MAAIEKRGRTEDGNGPIPTRCNVGITDYEWYRLQASRTHLDEVNFWQPGGTASSGPLLPGELFLFKLHAPRHSIVGGGFFAHATRLPVSLAWEAFGEANGGSLGRSSLGDSDGIPASGGGTYTDRLLPGQARLRASPETS